LLDAFPAEARHTAHQLSSKSALMPLSAAQDYPLWINSLIFLVAAVFIWFAGTRLVRYLDAIAVKTGLGQAFVGMLLLGSITSLPEIANVMTSSWTGNPSLAINNLLGSASINVLLLAIADSFIGRDALTSLVAQPATLMQAALSMIVMALVATAITSGDTSVLGIGAWSIAVFASSIGAFWLCAQYERTAPWVVKEEPQSKERGIPGAENAGPQSLRLLIAKAAVVGVVIFVAGYCLSQTGDALAVQTGLGSGFVGFVLIGVSTSLPELSTIVAALRMRKYEMAIGEVLGTNFVNVSLILLADAMFTGGPVINELGRFEIASALLGIVLTGVLLIGLLERRNPTFLNMGYDSLAIMLAFSGGLVMLYALR
jgi:cation:H+ antiporter